jgi:hypothetical protein
LIAFFFKHGLNALCWSALPSDDNHFHKVKEQYSHNAAENRSLYHIPCLLFLKGFRSKFLKSGVHIKLIKSQACCILPYQINEVARTTLVETSPGVLSDYLRQSIGDRTILVAIIHSEHSDPDHFKRIAYYVDTLGQSRWESIYRSLCKRRFRLKMILHENLESLIKIEVEKAMGNNAIEWSWITFVHSS